MRYRKLNNEIVRLGDVASSCGKPEESICFADPGESCIGQSSNMWANNFWYRPIKDNWIAFADQKPTKEDRANASGCVLVRQFTNEGVSFMHWSATPGSDQTHWMPLAFTPEAPPTIKVDGNEVTPQKDGSIKLSCGTVIPAKDVEELLRQRQEAMKS